MKKFSEYASRNEQPSKKENNQNIKSNQSAFELLKRVASKYEGASEGELISAIMQEARRAKERGELSEKEIENFVNSIYPMLNAKQRKQLNEVVQKIKNGD